MSRDLLRNLDSAFQGLPWDPGTIPHRYWGIKALYMALSDSLEAAHQPLAEPTLSIESQARAFRRRHVLHSISSTVKMLCNRMLWVSRRQPGAKVLHLLETCSRHQQFFQNVDWGYFTSNHKLSQTMAVKRCYICSDHTRKNRL